MNDQIKVPIVSKGRPANSFVLIDFELAWLCLIISSVKHVTWIYAVRASRKRGDWSVLSGPWRTDVEAAVRIETSPHVPFYRETKETDTRKSLRNASIL